MVDEFRATRLRDPLSLLFRLRIKRFGIDVGKKTQDWKNLCLRFSQRYRSGILFQNYRKNDSPEPRKRTKYKGTTRYIPTCELVSHAFESLGRICSRETRERSLKTTTDRSRTKEGSERANEIKKEEVHFRKRASRYFRAIIQLAPKI